jgi:hypothetical protein
MEEIGCESEIESICDRDYWGRTADLRVEAGLLIYREYLVYSDKLVWIRCTILFGQRL